MARFDCLVDTQPMARELESVSHKVNGTTAAVIGMQTAVIRAEAEAANHVCENVNRGFHTLIHSQISQKIAHLQSDVDSHLMKLNQHRQQLLNIKSRMERDYGMLKGRYSKLFNGINKNLEMRVFELDRPTINLAVRDSSSMSNRTMQLTATMPVAQLESLTISQRILASNMKYRCNQLVGTINNFLIQHQKQEKLTERILLDASVQKDITEIMVPVIVSESNYDAFNHVNKSVLMNEQVFTAQSREAIRKGVYEAQMEWTNSNDISKEIKSEFYRCMKESSASDRVKSVAQQLFLANKFQVIKGE
jgi:hypothetical protein